ncbi:MAG: hypothetical protein AB7O56_11805 [Bauldia sp.]
MTPDRPRRPRDKDAPPDDPKAPKKELPPDPDLIQPPVQEPDADLPGGNDLPER